MKHNIVFDLTKVLYATFVYVNQEGDISRYDKVSVRGIRFDRLEYAHPMYPEYPLETMYERAKRLGILDVWTPRVTMTFVRGTLVFKGERANEIWKMWNTYIFSKQKKGK